MVFGFICKPVLEKNRFGLFHFIILPSSHQKNQENNGRLRHRKLAHRRISRGF